MAGTRKSLRATAGNLPARFIDDIVEDGLHENMAPNTSSPHTGPSTSGVQARSGSRPRGRPRTRDLGKTPQKLADHSAASVDCVVYPQAAFPSLDPTAPDVIKMKKLKTSAREQRDSMDVRATEPPRKTSLDVGTPEFQFRYPSVKKYRLDGAWIDKDGNTLHGMASYYEAHAQEYEGQSKDNQGDSKEKNKAFLEFLETPEGQAAQLAGRGNSAREFEKWFHGGGYRSSTKGVEDERLNAGFQDELFAALHFKLQYCIMLEIEEDLVRYPPEIRPYETSGRSFRYARDILKIGSVAAVQSLQQKMQESMDQPELMPKVEDYELAKGFLRRRGLPVSLLGIYDYLDRGTCK